MNFRKNPLFQFNTIRTSRFISDIVWALHRECFAASSLPIGKNAHIVAVESGTDQLLDFGKDFALG